MDKDKLLEAAADAAKLAYCPYSKYRVGAALLCKDGTVVCGCNVENASFGLTNCAERTAVFSAVAQGKREFVALAIAGGTKKNPAYPCGACRQVLREFMPLDAPIVIGTRAGKLAAESTLSALLPDSFGPASL